MKEKIRVIDEIMRMLALQEAQKKHITMLRYDIPDKLHIVSKTSIQETKKFEKDNQGQILKRYIINSDKHQLICGKLNTLYALLMTLYSGTSDISTNLSLKDAQF